MWSLYKKWCKACLLPYQAESGVLPTHWKMKFGHQSCQSNILNSIMYSFIPPLGVGCSTHWCRWACRTLGIYGLSHDSKAWWNCMVWHPTLDIKVLCGLPQAAIVHSFDWSSTKTSFYSLVLHPDPSVCQVPENSQVYLGQFGKDDCYKAPPLATVEPLFG